MFFFLSKILAFLISPIFWVFALLLYSFFTKKDRLAKRLRIAAVVLLYIFSNPFLVDEAFRAWQLESSRHHSEQEVENLVGAYLGQRLAKDLDMEWVSVTDEYGTDYAVRSRKYEVMSFPFAVVSKRIQDSKYDFLVAVYHAVEHTLKESDHMPRPS